MDNRTKLINLLTILEPREIDQLLFNALQYAVNGYQPEAIDKEPNYGKGISFVKEETKEKPEDRQITYKGNKCTVREAIIMAHQDNMHFQMIIDHLCKATDLEFSWNQSEEIVRRVLGLDVDGNIGFIGAKNG